MNVILSILCVIGLLFIASCTSEPEIKPSMPAIYIVGENGDQPQVATYVVGEKDNLNWMEETKSQRYELNKIRAIWEDEDNQEEFELKSKLSNVVRTIDNELIIGYDEELDNPRWK